MHAYDLVSETIRKQIKLGKYQPGMKLPKEIELADRMGVSRKTLRTALEELEAAGLIIRRKHAGTIIADDAQERVDAPITIGIALPMDANISLASIYGPGTEDGSMESQLLIRRLLKEKFMLNLFYSDWGGELHSYDGVIVLSPMDCIPLLERLAEMRKPHITLETHYDCPGVNTVMGDDEEATRICVSELAELGHRKIAFIGGRLGPPGRKTGFRRRTNEFCRACREHGLETKPEWIFNEEHLSGEPALSRQEHTNVPPSYAEMESPFWSWKNTVWRLPHFRNRNCAVSICAHSTARNRKSPFFRSSRDSTGPGSRLQTRLMKNCMHGWAIRHIAPGVFLCLTGKIRNDMGKAQRCKELFPDPEPSF